MKAKKIDWISEYNEELDEQIYYIVDEQNNRFNLTDALDYKINEISQIVNDDFVFVCVDYYTGDELTGIFSYKQKKMIFPFIITSYNSNDKCGYIYLELHEELCETELMDFDPNLNVNNNFVYLNQDGSSFQNEGTIEEKISTNYYILHDKSLGSFLHFNYYTYKLYSLHFDNDDHIGYRDITNYELSEDKKVLTLEIGNGDNTKIIKVDLK